MSRSTRPTWSRSRHRWPLNSARYSNRALRFHNFSETKLCGVVETIGGEKTTFGYSLSGGPYERRIAHCDGHINNPRVRQEPREENKADKGDGENLQNDRYGLSGRSRISGVDWRRGCGRRRACLVL